MKKALRLGTALLLSASLIAPSSFAQNPPAAAPKSQGIDPQTFITQAGEAYYNLRSAGLGGFQCGIEPDWNALLTQQRKEDSEAADETIRIFSTLHFTVAVGADGRTVLNHDDVVTDSRRLAGAMEQVIGGMENISYGFFTTWVLFALASPLPDPAADSLRIDAVDAQYRLSYRDGAADMVINLGHDYAIQAIRLTQPGFRTFTEPVFMSTANGFILESYDYRAETGSGSGPDSAEFHVHVAIAYQQVDGFQLPQRLDINGSAAGMPFTFSLVLSDCHTARNDTGSV